jgi:dinuclear metal center YbgI/SA1388 family protein
MTLQRIAAWLDRELRHETFEDDSHNGLQVANAGRVTRVACGVDASMAFFREARSRGCDFLVCHHGLSWGNSLARITGLNYSRVGYLIRNGMALYASHLPLDAHPRLGNNIGIARALGLRKLRPFGVYRGRKIGFAGSLPKAMPIDDFLVLARRAIAAKRLNTMLFGPRKVRTVGVVSGGAAMEIREAGEDGLDVYLSGEPNLAAWSMAEELGVNGVFAGHYATEVFGVRALGRALSSRFRLPVEFIDLGVSY